MLFSVGGDDFVNAFLLQGLFMTGGRVTNELFLIEIVGVFGIVLEGDLPGAYLSMPASRLGGSWRVLLE